MAVPITSRCFVLHKKHLFVTSINSEAQWIMCLTTNLEVGGSSPTGVQFFDFLKKNCKIFTIVKCLEYANLNCPYLDIKY